MILSTKNKDFHNYRVRNLDTGEIIPNIAWADDSGGRYITRFVEDGITHEHLQDGVRIEIQSKSNTPNREAGMSENAVLFELRIAKKKGGLFSTVMSLSASACPREGEYMHVGGKAYKVTGVAWYVTDNKALPTVYAMKYDPDGS